MSAVPPMVNFSGVLSEVNGKPISGVVGVTFSLYKDSQGGAPLWMETQNVRPDKTGHYTVMLGSTSSHGLPTELFASGQARWLGIQAQGQAEQPRLLLLSVPYALKAGDAATLGGLPASAFLMAAGAAPVVSAAGASAANAGAGAPPPVPCNVTSDNTAVANQVAKFTAGCNVEPSAITEAGGNVGIGNSAPSTTLDVKGNSTFRGIANLAAGTKATATKGGNSQPLNFTASAFNSGTLTAVNQNFRFQAEFINNNTTTPSGTLNLLFASGTNAFAETGFKFASNGVITFAAGQTFPGTGTVTSVASGAGLTGGPITHSGTLSIASGGVTNAMLQHPSLTVTAGTGLSGGGAVALGSSTTLNNTGILGIGAGSGITSTGGQTPTLAIDTGVVPTLAGVNLFSGFSDFDGNEPVWEMEVSNAGAGSAILASNTSSDSSHPTMRLTNTDVTDAGDLVFDAVGPSFGGECTIDVSGNLFCTSPISSVVSTAGNRKVGLYTVLSSENWVEDFGSARLSGGVAKVNVESRFGQAIAAANYHVFLTPAGDCQGLYVTNRTATSFEVRELRGGKSNIEFDYRIVAHRKGFEAARLPDVTSRFARKTTSSNLQQAKAVNK